jgi:hypothetical protein
MRFLPCCLLPHLVFHLLTGNTDRRNDTGFMEAVMAVTKLCVTSRQPFANGKPFGQVGPYEQLDGTVYFAVDPAHPANHSITDLALAPHDANGRVHCSAAWRLLRPAEPARGNHRLLFDILNRGKGLALGISTVLRTLPRRPPSIQATVS